MTKVQEHLEQEIQLDVLLEATVVTPEPKHPRQTMQQNHIVNLTEIAARALVVVGRARHLAGTSRSLLCGSASKACHSPLVAYNTDDTYYPCYATEGSPVPHCLRLRQEVEAPLLLMSPVRLWLS